MPKYLVSYTSGYTKQLGKPVIRHKTVNANNRIEATNKVKGGFTAEAYRPIKSHSKRKTYAVLETKSTKKKQKKANKK